MVVGQVVVPEHANQAQLEKKETDPLEMTSHQIGVGFLQQSTITCVLMIVRQDQFKDQKGN